MIIKHFNLKKNINKNINFYLLYGNNTGLIEDTINDTLKPNFSKNIFYYEETEILSDPNRFKEEAYNNSFFDLTCLQSTQNSINHFSTLCIAIFIC